jgi:single-strand DNA-binding protein
MAGLIKIIVIGNLGTDPEMRYTPQGIPMTTFRLATTRTFSNASGERQDETEWFSVVAWRRLAEQCNQYLSKGRRAYVEGRLRSRTWQGQDGQQRFQNQIVAERVFFLDRAPAAAQGPEEAEAVSAGPAEAEEVPFEDPR